MATRQEAQPDGKIHHLVLFTLPQLPADYEPKMQASRAAERCRGYRSKGKIEEEPLVAGVSLVSAPRHRCCFACCRKPSQCSTRSQASRCVCALGHAAPSFARHTRRSFVAIITQLCRVVRCCPQASFAAAGARGMSKEQTCEALNWPDKTAGATHALTVIADDVASLKAYLHSELHLKEWMAHMKPAGATGPPIVFDSPLVLPL